MICLYNWDNVLCEVRVIETDCVLSEVWAEAVETSIEYDLL
jgi:hypothetical protein